MENLRKISIGTVLVIVSLGVLSTALMPFSSLGVPIKPKSIYITYCHKNNGGGIDLYKTQMELKTGRFTGKAIAEIEEQLATVHGCKPANIILVNTLTIEE